MAPLSMQFAHLCMAGKLCKKLSHNNANFSKEQNKRKILHGGGIDGNEAVNECGGF